ncbi:hypothetical protein ACG74X_13165 [Marivita sp. S0852]|uniref:hypothetical protein n=1 Tax=Marivita sp. S0852 TaxID=3373893 RepID=UPI003981E536
MQVLLTKRILLSSIAASALVFAAKGVRAADPGDTAAQIYAIYVDAMTQTNAALEGSPPVTLELGADLDTIKEAAVTKLVALGHDVAAMSASDRASVEGKLSSLVSSIHRDPATKDVYTGYQSIWKAYVGEDQEFFEKIKSLNILTQYAFFDLLRKQEPDEADRLGV